MLKPANDEAIPPDERLASACAIETLDYEQLKRKRPVLGWLAFLLAALTILIRLAYSRPWPFYWDFALDFDPMSDQLEYIQLANSLWSGHGLNFWREGEGLLHAFRMPGYPLFLALCRMDFRIIIAAQAVLDASSLLAMYIYCRRRIGTAAAVLASLAIAFNPFLIFLSSKFLSETLFTALLAWGVFCLLSSTKWSQAVGLLIFSLATYARPSAVGLPIAAAVLIFWHGEKIHERIFRGFVAAAIAGVVLFLVLLPWGIRNESRIGSFVLLTTNGGHTAYDSFNPQADGSSNQADFRKALEEYKIDPWNGSHGNFNWSTEYPNTEVGRSQFLSFCARHYALQHPGRVVQLAFAKLARFWSPVPLSADFGGRWLYVAVGGLYAVPLFVFAAVGLWRGKLSRRSKLILLLPAIYFSLVHSVFVGSLRYRVPCDVPLAVLAAAGVVSLFERKPAAESA